MATLELVEKLREYANVTYQEASDALDACDDDILEAILYLERLGKVSRPKEEEPQQSTAHYSTQSQTPPPEFTSPPPQEETFGDLMKRFTQWLLKWLRIANKNHFVIRRRGQVIISLPVSLLIFFLLISFGTVIFFIIFGMFFGFTYRIQGEDIRDDSSINETMDAAARAAEDLKTTVHQKHDNTAESGDESENSNHKE